MQQASQTPPEQPSTKNSVDTDRAVDLVNATAVGAARLARMPSEGVPRLCVGAACRTVERLANSENEQFRAQAVLAAHDLRQALEEAIANVDAMLKLLDSDDTTTTTPM